VTRTQADELGDEVTRRARAPALAV
jgi:hypothetical protein